ncbi:hypothetical protein [Polyangium fumosum]|uniref:Uncharacterized protein n=1 Tax=Polyangium fumosum TaxID=889272 RepID=A0A4U1IWP2_9BACT|nr:hypothetical protein [Polyangium fumosum]TKC98450.1 hypothetical protein E8A74_41265 [Polyangium fumosum]
MTVKVSRMVADRVAITNTVVAAIQIHGPSVAPALDALLFPNGVPPGMTMGHVVTALGQLLGRITTSLVEADQVHTNELADDDGYRKRREQTIADLRGQLFALRTAFTNNYDVSVAAAYGLAVALPDDNQSLIHTAGSVEKLLRTRPLIEKPKMKGLTIDPLLTADDLKAAADAMQSALGDVERERREAQATLDKKNTELETWGRRYPAIADLASLLFVLADRQALADRVKPTARRRAGLPETEDLPSDATPPAPAAPPETP